MPKTQVSCPNCRQPVVADVNQLFDLNADPTAKQQLLSGQFNLIQCQGCGYQGNLATPLVYHDPEKELLLTFVPPEIGLSRDDQEKMIGGLINRVVNALDQEKRKGYLFSPQATLTMQGMLERILEEDGITREMIEAQQQKLNLIQRLASASDEKVREEIIKQEESLVDAEFFALFNRLTEASMASGDQNAARSLSELQQILLTNTAYGRELQAQSQEIETAIADLRALGSDLTREKMLELVLDASSDTRVRALVSLARPVMDYSFFQMLTEQIDSSSPEDQTRLSELRTQLLESTQEIDKQIEAHILEIRQLIDMILQAEDTNAAMSQSMPYVDEYFIQELNRLLEEARNQGDLEKSSKLGKMAEVIEKANAAPPELELIEEFLEAPDDQAREQFLETNDDKITPEFMEMMANISVQVQAGDDKDLSEQVAAANRAALRYSMKRSMQS